jgi:hypothetical protein
MILRDESGWPRIKQMQIIDIIECRLLVELSYLIMLIPKFMKRVVLVHSSVYEL